MGRRRELRWKPILGLLLLLLLLLLAGVALDPFAVEPGFIAPRAPEDGTGNTEVDAGSGEAGAGHGAPGAEPETASRGGSAPSREGGGPGEGGGEAGVSDPGPGLPPGYFPRLDGKVVDVLTGEVVVGARVLYGPFPDGWGGDIGKDGTFWFEVPREKLDPERPFRRRVFAPGYETSDASPREKELTVELRPRGRPPLPGRIRGRAVDRDGQAVRGVIFVVLGEFLLDGVSPGGCRISLERGDRVSVFVPEDGEAEVVLRARVDRSEVEADAFGEKDAAKLEALLPEIRKARTHLEVLRKSEAPASVLRKAERAWHDLYGKAQRLEMARRATLERRPVRVVGLAGRDGGRLVAEFYGGPRPSAGGPSSATARPVSRTVSRNLDDDPRGHGRRNRQGGRGPRREGRGPIRPRGQLALRGRDPGIRPSHRGQGPRPAGGSSSAEGGGPDGLGRLREREASDRVLRRMVRQLRRRQRSAQAADQEVPGDDRRVWSEEVGARGLRLRRVREGAPVHSGDANMPRLSEGRRERELRDQGLRFGKGLPGMHRVRGG